MRPKITQEIFDATAPGEVFAKGEAPDSPDGLHMTGSSQLLRWVCVKGWADDWCMYCDWAYKHWSEIERLGQKVSGIHNIMRVIDIPLNLMKRYRI